MHKPVLLKEVIEYLNPQSGEDFVDATFGEGGHAQEILKLTSPSGKLLGIDLDPVRNSSPEAGAVSNGMDFESGFRLDTGSADLKASEPLSWSGIEPASLNQKDSRLFLEVGNFSNIENIASRFNLDKVDPVRSHPAKGTATTASGRSASNGVDGVLFDFGFRSYHIDESGRGFSYTKDEPLDMRYSYRSETSIGQTTAVDIVNNWSQNELERIFTEYGEERNYKKIAKAIVEARKQKKILTTGELVEILDRTHGSDRSYKTYSRIFQALRIAVNNELENIKKGLAGAWNILKPNGRLVAISFHSLEDRIVKNFFNDKKQSSEGIVLTKKPVIASAEELSNNSRSKSAKLRAIRKT